MIQEIIAYAIIVVVFSIVVYRVYKRVIVGSKGDDVCAGCSGEGCGGLKRSSQKRVKDCDEWDSKS